MITISVLESLAEAMVHELDLSAPRAARDACRKFVASFYRVMQPAYRAVFMVLTAWFTLSSLMACRKTPAKMTVEERSGMAERWRRSRLPLKKDFIKVLFTLVVLSYYDDEATTSKLGIERATYLRILSFYSGSTSDE